MLPVLYKHTGLISFMFAAIHWYKEITRQEPPKESIEEWVKAYDDLWSIAVYAQTEEFKNAVMEGRKPDYLPATIKQFQVSRGHQDATFLPDRRRRGLLQQDYKIIIIDGNYPHNDQRA